MRTNLDSTIDIPTEPELCQSLEILTMILRVVFLFLSDAASQAVPPPSPLVHRSSTVMTSSCLDDYDCRRPPPQALLPSLPRFLSRHCHVNTMIANTIPVPTLRRLTPHPLSSSVAYHTSQPHQQQQQQQESDLPCLCNAWPLASQPKHRELHN